jgi:hypothetical protein
LRMENSIWYAIVASVLTPETTDSLGIRTRRPAYVGMSQFTRDRPHAKKKKSE